MKRLLLLTALAFTASTAMAYSINGSSDTKFVLKCNDGTTNTSVMPPNHNSAVEFCKDHGGVAAGYPKELRGLMKAKSRASAATKRTSPVATPVRSGKRSG